jgi:hypothetical protein
MSVISLFYASELCEIQFVSSLYVAFTWLASSLLFGGPTVGYYMIAAVYMVSGRENGMWVMNWEAFGEKSCGLMNLLPWNLSVGLSIITKNCNQDT